MAGVFKSVLSRLNSNPLEAVATTLEFGKIEPGDLAKRLDLQRQGSERGKKNEPPTTDTSFDSVEHTIVTEIEDYRRRAVDVLTRSLEAYSARLQAFDFQQVRLDVIAALNKAKADFIAEVHQGENELYQKRRSVVGTTKDVDKFRVQHRLTRLYHPPPARLWTIGFLLFLLLFEAGPINGALFAGGLPGGFIEGMGIAAGIAVLNVAVGFVTGLCVVRFLLYRSITAKFFAAIGLVLDIVLCFILNLGIARFRTALNTTDPEAALISAFGIPPIEVLQHLADINGFQSYILIGVGILFHLAALADGFKFDDPYPFYGKYWRKRESAETDYSEKSEHLIAYLTQQRDETTIEMQDASRSLSSSRRLAARIAENRVSTRQRFEVYLDNLERIGNQLLTLYREANRSQRSAPAPPHFAKLWKFESRRPLTESSPKGSNWADDEIAKRTQDDLEKGIVEVNEHYVKAIATYEKIRSMLEEELVHAQTVRPSS